MGNRGKGVRRRVAEEERFDRRDDGEELIQSETFEEVRDKRKRNERRASGRKGEGAISGGTRQDDRALNHRRS